MRRLIVGVALCVSCVPPPPSGDAYQRALAEPVWNLQPIDAAALAAEYRANPARAEARYERKVVRVRGVVGSIVETPAAVGGAWAIALQSERGGDADARFFCALKEREEVARLEVGSVVTVTGSLEGAGSSVWARACSLERVGADGPAAVEPQAVTPSPDYAAEVVVEAEALDAAYRSDATAAAATYGGRPLVITGTLVRASSGLLMLKGTGMRLMMCRDLRVLPTMVEGTRVTIRAKVQTVGFPGIGLWACSALRWPSPQSP